MKDNIKIIALNGPKGVGKTTVARALEKSLQGYAETVIVSYASPIKEMAKALGVADCYLLDPDYKEKLIPGLGISARVLLQTLGTDWGRQMVSENIWLWAMDRAIEKATRGLVFDEDPLFIIIDDCRFDNEADHVRKNGGVVVTLMRNDVGYTGEHSSEKALSSPPDDLACCDYIHDAARDIVKFASKKFDMPALLPCG